MKKLLPLITENYNLPKLTFLTERQLKLLNQVVIPAHKGQYRKYGPGGSPTPYWHHVLRVSHITFQYIDLIKFPLAVEKALCHDVIEDTYINTVAKLVTKLIEVGYTIVEAKKIAQDVNDELTNVYTKENHPNKNSATRKALEGKRLWTIGEECQTIKFADIYDNTWNIDVERPNRAKTYKSEKAFAIKGMKLGSTQLKNKIKKILLKR